MNRFIIFLFLRTRSVTRIIKGGFKDVGIVPLKKLEICKVYQAEPVLVTETSVVPGVISQGGGGQSAQDVTRTGVSGISST